MKTLSQIRLFSTLCSFLLLSANVFSQTPPPVTTIGTATYSAGNYNVPVTVSGFVNVGNISMRINYDATRLTYAGVVVNTGLIPSRLVVTPVSNQSGQFRLSYSSSVAIVLGTPASTLFTLIFTPKAGVQGVRIPLIWSTGQGDCDITPPVPATFTPPITLANMSTYFINGYINVAPVPVIAGPASPCAGSTGNVYSTEPGMTAYVWTISAGGTITAGNGTNTISVTWNSQGANNVSVTYTHPIAGPALSPTIYPVNVLLSCNKTVNLKLYIEGIYTGGGAMRKAQGSAGDQYPGTTADQISVELHDAVTYATIIFTVNNINLSTAGLASFTVPSSYAGSYYITVRHRNSIETVSSAPVSFAAATINYDFSTGAGMAYGGNLRNVAGVYLIYSGDTNQDGFIGVSDMSAIDNQSAIFGSGYLVEDINGDGFIGVSDMAVVDNNSANFISKITP